jgi:hypothetical protein
VYSDQRDVTPKDKAPKIQLDPGAAPTASEQRPIQEIDRKRQQPKNQTNNQMFAPVGLHHLLSIKFPGEYTRRYELDECAVACAK